MSAPVYDVDFYGDDFIRDPHPRYAEMRALGPVVWLPQNGAFAVARFEEVRTVLRDWRRFSSAEGLSLIPRVNAILKGSTLNSDPPIHDETRSITAAPLTPTALKSVEPRIRAAAETLVERLVARGAFDAVSDFATHLPLTIVAELVGLSGAGRDKMLKWASATFNLFGDENDRSKAAFADLEDLAAYLETYGRLEHLAEDGWARRIFDVGARDGIPFETCAQLMRDYINPSLDTTIAATGEAIRLFAENPGEWDRLRAEPALIPNAIEEVVRLSTPIRAFSRHLAEETTLAGVSLPRGARVIAVYASANLDPARYEAPERFDVGRRVRDHLGFGHGPHMCMGAHLARLEIRSLLEALAPRVSRFRLTGAPVVSMNNTIRAWASLPVAIERG